MTITFSTLYFTTAPLCALCSQNVIYYLCNSFRIFDTVMLVGLLGMPVYTTSYPPQTMVDGRWSSVNGDRVKLNYRHYVLTAANCPFQKLIMETWTPKWESVWIFDYCLTSLETTHPKVMCFVTCTKFLYGLSMASCTLLSFLWTHIKSWQRTHSLLSKAFHWGLTNKKYDTDVFRMKATMNSSVSLQPVYSLILQLLTPCQTHSYFQSLRTRHHK